MLLQIILFPKPGSGLQYIFSIFVILLSLPEISQPCYLYLLLLLLYCCSLLWVYNTLVGRKNQVENAFGTIDAMLKKRFDLIPNLVETVKQYMTYEQDTLTKIVALRNSIQQQPNMPAQERIGLENQLTGLLSNLRIAVENYPDLKANNSFIQLQSTGPKLKNKFLLRDVLTMPP